MFFVTGQKRSDRLTICQGCEHFVQSTKSCGPLVTEAFTDSKLCGCHMPTKTRLKVASCPLGKWEAEIKESDLDAIRTLIENPQDATNGDLAELYSKATGTNTKASQCSSCNRRMFNELKQLLKEADKQ
jgi:hypothetical protein